MHADILKSWSGNSKKKWTSAQEPFRSYRFRGDWNTLRALTVTMRILRFWSGKRRCDSAMKEKTFSCQSPSNSETGNWPIESIDSCLLRLSICSSRLPRGGILFTFFLPWVSKVIYLVSPILCSITGGDLVPVILTLMKGEIWRPGLLIDYWEWFGVLDWSEMVASRIIKCLLGVIRCPWFLP